MTEYKIRYEKHHKYSGGPLGSMMGDGGGFRIMVGTEIYLFKAKPTQLNLFKEVESDYQKIGTIWQEGWFDSLEPKTILNISEKLKENGFCKEDTFLDVGWASYIVGGDSRSLSDCGYGKPGLEKMIREQIEAL